MAQLWLLGVSICVLLLVASVACQTPSAEPNTARLHVVATTSILADVVANVGGERIDLTALLPHSADPHTFEPTPQDVALLTDADVVFINGAGLEPFLSDILDDAGPRPPVVSVSQSIELLRYEPHRVPADGEPGERAEGETDPHTWFAPGNVMLWVADIEAALSEADPSGAETYQANAQAYTERLQELDRWIREQVSSIPTGQRTLVTDHTVLAYFAHTYGFSQVGAVVPAYSTLAQPSARQIADLQETIEHHGVRAVFVGSTANQRLAQQVAEDTGVRLVPLFTGSLTDKAGPAGNYVTFMRYNVTAIVNGLR